MPCLVVLLAVCAPRLVLALLALFTGFLSTAFVGWLWPLLGFVWLPLTTLAYAAALNFQGHLVGPWLGAVVAAALSDLGAVGAGRRLWARHRRR